MEFTKKVPINPGTFLAVKEWDDMEAKPTGRVIYIGNKTGELYAVSMEEHERRVRWRKNRLQISRRREIVHQTERGPAA